MAKKMEVTNEVDVWQGVYEQADAIRRKIGSEVMPFTFKDPENEGGLIIGFIKKPDFYTLLNYVSQLVLYQI